MADKVAEALEELLDECAFGLTPIYSQSNFTHNNQEAAIVAESSQEAAVVAESSKEAAVVDESSEEAAVVAESSEEAAVVAESSKEVAIVGKSSQEAAVVAESSQVLEPEGILTLDQMIEKYPDLKRLQPLLGNLPYATVSEERTAVKKLWFLSAESFVVPQFFEVKRGAINQLLNEKTIRRAYSDSSLQADLVAIVFMILYHKLNRGKIVVADCPAAVPFLLDSLRAFLTSTRREAAASLYLLSTLESNKLIIGQFGAIGPLIRRIEAETDEMAFTFVNAALCNLCTVVENRKRAVSEGAVKAVTGKITSLNRFLVDELKLGLLALLSSHEWRIPETEANDMLHCLFGKLGVKGTPMNKECEEHCVVIAHRLRLDTRRIENGRQTLERIANNGGTEMAREKASELLHKLGCFWMQ